MVITLSKETGKISVFGSYAKGKQVEHQYGGDGIFYEYISDYDFLELTWKQFSERNALNVEFKSLDMLKQKSEQIRYNPMEAALWSLPEQ